jgi:D-alanine-D-alanine ligase
LAAASPLRVAVLMGGRSSEHDVSLASGRSVVDGLVECGFDVLPIEIARDGSWAVDPARPDELFHDVDVVFPVLHGPFGEDGTVQGMLELADVAYVGAGVTASSVGMDKDTFKAVMRDKEIPVARSVTLRRSGDATFENPYGYPVVVKPARLGSSYGITIVRGQAELAAAISLAFAHDEKILVEEFLDGVEVECSVLGNDDPLASVPGEIVPLKADWYDYASKYDEGGSELVIPPPGLSAAQIERAQQVAVQAFVATDCEGMARADFFVRDPDGEIVMNELNTIPGFTATSFYTRLLEASGWTYERILDRLIELALERRERRKDLRY